MEDGSRQVKFSREGLMTPDLEACLKVVTKALAKGSVPASDVVTWCDKMIRSDRVGLICNQELNDLRKRVDCDCQKASSEPDF